MRRPFVRAVLCAALPCWLVSAACAPNFDGQVPCKSDLECQAGTHCVSGKCSSGNSAPHLVIDSPSAGAYLSGSIDVKISADDPDGVKSVALATADGKALGLFTAPDAAFGKLKATQFTISGVDTTKLADGKVTLQATGTDRLGVSGVGATLDINVANTTVTAGAITVAPDPAKKSAQLSISFSTSGPSSAAGVTVAGNAATQASKTPGTAGDAYVFNYTVSGNEAPGAVPVVATVANLAGVTTTKSTTVTLVFTAPAAPLFTGSVPASPNKSVSTSVTGTAAAGTTVTLYANSTCTGTAAGTGTAAVFAAAGIPVTVPAQSAQGAASSTTFFATATDAAGNVSACSSGTGGSLTYLAWTLTPSAPTFSGSTPASPGKLLNPAIKGVAVSGSTVALFTNPSCTGSPNATGPAALFNAAGIGATVAAQANLGTPSSTTFNANVTDPAGNVSACSSGGSGSLTYLAFSLVPTPPSFTGSVPPSPATSTTPFIKGTSVPGTTVSLFKAADCSGAPVGSASDATFANAGIQVTVPAQTIVGTASSTSLSATAVDAAGNVSACSSPFVYRAKTLPPAPPSINGSFPASPTNAQPVTLALTGNAEPGSTVSLYLGAACGGTLVGSNDAGSFGGAGVSVSPIPSGDGTTAYVALATDQAGNLSGCSSPFNFVINSTVPNAPTFNATTTPPSPDNSAPSGGSASVLVNGQVSSPVGGLPVATVKIFNDPACANPPVGTGTAGQFTGAGISVSVARDTAVTFYARAFDAANNSSACSNGAQGSVSFIEDNSESPPQIIASAPLPPSNLGSAGNPGSTLNLIGTADSGPNHAPDTVYFYANDPTCNGGAITGGLKPPVGSGPGSSFTAAGVPVPLVTNAVTSYFALSQDSVGNASTCSAAPFIFTSDTQEAAPVITGVSNATPNPGGSTTWVTASNAPPTISGTGVVGVTAATIQLYSVAGCGSGGLIAGASSPLASDGTWSIPFTPSMAAMFVGNTSTNLYPASSDLAGNSACDATGIGYVFVPLEAAPASLATNPISPTSVSNTPSITGNTQVLPTGVTSTVQLFTGATACASAVPNTTSTAGQGGSFSIPLPIASKVANNSATTFWVQVTDSLGNSTCSTSVNYTYVPSEPAPTGMGINPTSPSTVNTQPTVSGTTQVAVAGATVAIQLFKGATSCQTAIGAAPTNIGQGGAFSIQVPAGQVTANSATNFWIKVTDSAGNSVCSTAVPYVYVPSESAPASLASTPGPSPIGNVPNGATPTLSGTTQVLPAGATSTVQIYKGATACLTAIPGAVSSAGQGGAFSIPIPNAQALSGNTANSFWAKVTDSLGNSACSAAALNYVFVPSEAAPSGLATTPGPSPVGSVANGATPTISGSTQVLPAGVTSTVQLFTGASACLTAVPNSTSTASQGGAFSIPLPAPSALAGNTSTNFWVKVVDSLANSACSAAPLNYVYVPSESAPSGLSSNPGPSPVGNMINGATPTIGGSTQVLPGGVTSTVQLFTGATACATAVPNTTTSPGQGGAFSIPLPAASALGSNTATNFWAKVTDSLANSSCSLVLPYVYVASEAAPTLGGTNSPNNTATPSIIGTTQTVPAAVTVSVQLFTGASGCTTSVGSLTGLGQGGAFVVSPSVPLISGTTTNFWVKVTDTVGNSTCAGPRAYVFVASETAPVFAANTTPASPSNATATPTFTGTVQNNPAGVTQTVQLYSGNNCQSLIAGNTAAASGGAFSLGLIPAVTAPSSNPFTIKVSDNVGNTSSCSSPITYVYVTSTATPVFNSTTAPASPSNASGNVNLSGAADTGASLGIAPATVYLYAGDPNCAGRVPGTQTASGSAVTFASGIGVPIVANASTNYYAFAIDAATNKSACSAPVTFTDAQFCPASGLKRAQFYNGQMQGCAGNYTFPARACAAGAHVCGASEYAALNGNTPPQDHYWTDDDLNYLYAPGVCGGGGSNTCNSGNCVATALSGPITQSCGASSPFRVCDPIHPTDSASNSCNWVNCGFNTVGSGDFFGGCGSTTAGVLCCKGPTVVYVDAATGLDTNVGSRASPFKTIKKALTVAINANDTIKVSPGTYDAASGEAFPINVPAGVLLLGDEATRGAGPPTATKINGSGTVNMAAGSTIAGFTVTTSTNALTLNGSGVTVRNNSLISNGGYGIWVQGSSSGHTILLNNIGGQGTANFGGIDVFSGALGGKVESNSITYNSFGIVLNTPGPNFGDGTPTGSVGNNTLSCNINVDFYCNNSSLSGIQVQFAHWDHAPVNISPTVTSGGMDLYYDNSCGITFGTANLLAAAPCP